MSLIIDLKNLCCPRCGRPCNSGPAPGHEKEWAAEEARALAACNAGVKWKKVLLGPPNTRGLGAIKECS